MENNLKLQHLLAFARTHLLVSSSCWIFLCSSRLLALHTDILPRERERERERSGGEDKIRK